jgi:hypothetical protein
MSYSINELVIEINKDKKPVVLHDTCSLLDIVRTPERDNIIPGIISSAIDFTSKSDIWLIASNIVNVEWNDNIDNVISGSRNAIRNLHKKASIFKGALDHAPIVDKWAYNKLFTSYELEEKLKDLSKSLLNNLTFIKEDADCLTRASIRVIKTIAPASKGKDEYKDCMIIEHYLELCRKLRDSGFSEQIVFVSSNKTDFGSPYDIKKPLDSEFSSVQLTYVSDLYQAAQAVP